MMAELGRIHLALGAAAFLTACATAAPPARENLPEASGPTETPATPTPTPSAPIPAFTPSGNLEFDAWRKEFAQRAQAAGRNVDVIYAVLEGLVPMPEAETMSFADNQPEFVKPIWDYVNSACSPARVSAGRTKLGENAQMFDLIEAEYGVPREILTAIWGMETAYGKVLGSFDAPRQLATLGYKGRRTAFGESQLIAVMKLIEQGIVTREQLRTASWTGALGQTQFMPGTFLAYGRDGDGDGRQDLWGSQSDALASAANYLSRSGWKRGEPWALEATLPANMDYSLADHEKRSMAFWRSQGFSVADGRAAPDELMAELFMPAGAQGPSFFLFDNFYKIRVYNNADSYALSIGLLGDRLMNRPQLTKSWPTDVELPNKSEVMELQAGLNALGFDAGPVDGLAGRQTRAGLRAFQAASNIAPADGFVTKQMVAAVVAAAG